MLRTLVWRFALPTLLVITGAAFFVMPHVESLLTGWFRADVDMRAQLVMSSMEEPLTELVDRPVAARIKRYLAKVTADERLLAVLLCRPNGQAIYQTEQTPPPVSCAMAAMDDFRQGKPVRTPRGTVYVSGFEAVAAGGQAFRTLIVHDLSFVDRRHGTVRDYLIAFAVLAAAALALLTVAVAWLLLHGWVGALIRDIRGKRFQDDAESSRAALPVLSQVRQVLREIEDSQRLEMDYRENWTPRALQHVVREHLGEPRMIVVSNREPYVHMRGEDGRPRVQVPASGMV
ncbi:MAG: hypothetical protein ACOZCP_03450, partial [Pseudomonadota bacterium]